jgi:hypothetical protein
MRAGQDEAEGIPHARPHLFLECFLYQGVRKARVPWRPASPLRQHTTRERRKPRDALRRKAIVPCNYRRWRNHCCTTRPRQARRLFCREHKPWCLAV